MQILVYILRDCGTTNRLDIRDGIEICMKTNLDRDEISSKSFICIMTTSFSVIGGSDCRFRPRRRTKTFNI